jgi:hypothetical protein
MNTKLFKELYESHIKMAETIEILSIENNMLDNGYYLDWKDELNRLSIDKDR